MQETRGASFPLEERREKGCLSFSDYQKMTEKLEGEGYIFIGNFCSAEADSVIKSIESSPDVQSTQLTSAFSQPAQESMPLDPQIMSDHVGIWLKKRQVNG